MQENMKEYLTEKEAREKRLEVYTEKIQEKVLSRSSETIRKLVEERHRQKMTQQEKKHWGQTPVRENKDSESNIKSFLKMHKIQCECWID